MARSDVVIIIIIIVIIVFKIQVLSTNLEGFPAKSLYPFITPREVSISDHVGFSFARNKINPNH